MPPKKLKSGSSKSDSSSRSNKKKVGMKTTATPRRSASRGRLAPQQSLQAGGGGVSLQKQGTLSKGPRRAANTRRAATGTPSRGRKPATSPTRPRRRFQPPPPPPMYWICFDFSVKLCRGLFLGVFIGLILTVILPWMLDTGFFVYDTVTEKAQNIELVWPDMSNLTSSVSWNTTSSRIWRVDQPNHNLRGAAAKTPPPTPAPTQDPRTVADQLLMQNFPRGFNRTISLIHVGHTGGNAVVAASPNIVCEQRHDNNPTAAVACQKEQALRGDLSSSPLARQAQHYVHLGVSNPTALQQSTSFLFTLRNPVDRILAIFLDSHPLSCIPGSTSWGCTNQNLWKLPDTQQYSLYAKCFPEPSPEAFAQAVMQPWDNYSEDDKLIRNAAAQKHDCRWMAREMTKGVNALLTPLAPDMHYNYRYYADQTFGGRGQEVLAIRSEEEQTDLWTLQKLLGGNPAKTTMPPSFPPATPKVTPVAYQKLCCILEEEIQTYETLLQKVVNLPPYAKQEALDDVRKKCGLLSADGRTVHLGWDDWRMQCREKMDIDTVWLTPQQ